MRRGATGRPLGGLLAQLRQRPVVGRASPGGVSARVPVVVPYGTTAAGGRAGKAELLTGIEGVSSRPVRRIVLVGADGR
jgi:hypothetical protein